MPVFQKIKIHPVGYRSWWPDLIGKTNELTGQHGHYQANTVRDRVVLWSIFIGLKVIDDPRLMSPPTVAE